MKTLHLFLICIALFSGCFLKVQSQKAPIMGWSSWNHFRVNINEQLIREQADALIASGMYKAGYRFIDIDDGYFGGRDSSGKIFADAKKFPEEYRFSTSWEGAKTDVKTL